MGQFVIVAYRPREGKTQQLLDLVREHLPVLRREGLATERPPYVMRAEEGVIIEVFEWKSAEAVEQAHTNAAVQAMWGRFGEVCEYEILSNLKECQGMFASFAPIDLYVLVKT